MYSDLEPRLIVLDGKNLLSCIPSLMVHQAVYMTHMVMEMVLTLLPVQDGLRGNIQPVKMLYIYPGIRMPVVELEPIRFMIHLVQSLVPQILADFVHNRVIDTIREVHDSNWANRGVKTANFAEVNSSFNNEMPSILIELGFHDSSYDTQFLLDPNFRRDAARAMAFGIAEYFGDKDGTAVTLPPEPPEFVQTSLSSNGVVVSWESGDAGGAFGDNGNGLCSLFVYGW